MLSFSKILEDMPEEVHAYTMGVRAFYEHRLSLPPKLLLSPFERDSKEDTEWFDGYYDAYFIHYGVNLD